MLTNLFRRALPALFAIALAGPAAAELIEIETDTALKGVYLIPDDTAETVRVSAVILAGEADSDGPEGLAHYLEHLMFWHADGVSNRVFHNRGGNAWVNGIITNYYTDGPKADLDDLFAFAGRLVTPPALDPTFMADEKRIVAREYDLRVSENPRSRVQQRMNRELYGQNPVGRSLIGTPQSIESFDLDMVERFRRQFYVPDNMVLFASGDLNEDEVRRQVEKTFGGADAGSENGQPWRRLLPTEALARTIELIDDQTRMDSYQFSSLSEWIGSGDRLQDVYTLGFLNELLGSNLPGSLAKPLEINEFIVSAYSVRLDRKLRDQVQFLFRARPDEGVAPETVSVKLRDSLVALARSGVPEKSLERIRKRFFREADRRRDEPNYILGRALRNLTAGLDPNGADDHRERIAAVTKADVDTLIRAVADRHRFVEVNLKRRGS